MYLGIDLGTSELKALLLSEQHEVIATARAPLTVQRPQALWSEQDPAAWWQALEAVMDQLQREQPQALARLRGIGLSGQMHGATLLDEHDTVLRPAILWNDGRSGAQCQQLTRDVPDLAAITGNLAMPGFTAPKLLWVREHEPEVFAHTRRVLLPKDWLRLMLTGEAVSEMSDAAGTLWLDVGQRDWSDVMLAATGLARHHMPRLVEGSEVSAYVMPELCERWGLPDPLPVAGGAGDNAASAVGMGAVEAGQGFLSLGTSGVLFVVTPDYQPNAASATHAFCHAVPGRWHQMSVMLSAASSLQWVTDLLGAPNAGLVAEKAGALSAAQRATSPLFLPYLGGERTPHNDAHVRGSFHGLSFDTDAARLGYAVIEGVTFGLKDGLAALNAAGSSVQRLSLVGGGARSTFWAQQLASALDVEIVTHGSSAVGGALGAARLGWLATGADMAAVCLTPEVDATYRPDPADQPLLLERYATFRSLYRTT